MRVRHLILALLLVAAGATASAAAGDAVYRVQLDPSAAVDRTDAIGAELAATYGGSVEPSQSATGETILLRLTPAKARALASDPRVKSLAPLRARNNAVVEPVNWSAGVGYTYDGSGNMSAIGADEFLYDDVGRLVKAKINNTTREYSYDAFGNRTNCNQVSPSTACQFGYGINSNNNHLTGPVTYDTASGDVTILGPHHYDYDAEGLLVSDGATEFLYTAHDERIATHSGGLWRWSVRDSRGRTLRIFTSQDGPTGIGASTWQWVRDFVWRDALLLATRQKVNDEITTYHYHVDHLGTPRRITDQSDEIVGFHDYYAYGPEVSGGLSEPSRAELRYTGQERDDNGGEPYTLDYMHKRFYAPSLGRFLSLDREIGQRELPQSWNRYTYALDNPMRYVDPNGNAPKESKIIHVRVNVIYSNADNPGLFMSGTLRQRTEAGLIRARQHYAEMGIALHIQSYEGFVILNDKGLINGTVTIPGSGPMMVTDFVKGQIGRALTMMATPDIEIKGGSSGTSIVKGVPQFTILGHASNWKDAEHEMAHSFGNTMGQDPNGFTNAVTDFIWFAERTQHDLFPRTIGFSYWFEQQLREGAAKLEENNGGQ